jgi:hypothetical protein
VFAARVPNVTALKTSEIAATPDPAYSHIAISIFGKTTF